MTYEEATERVKDLKSFLGPESAEALQMLISRASTVKESLSVEKRTPPDPPIGFICEVKSSSCGLWRLRYADGNGKFYSGVGNISAWDIWRPAGLNWSKAPEWANKMIYWDDGTCSWEDAWQSVEKVAHIIYIARREDFEDVT